MRQLVLSLGLKKVRESQKPAKGDGVMTEKYVLLEDGLGEALDSDFE